VRLTNDLQSCKDELELEVWSFFLKLIDNFSNQPQFFEEWNLILILVKEHPRDMPIFNQKYILSYAPLKSDLSHISKEWCELP